MLLLYLNNSNGNSSLPLTMAVLSQSICIPQILSVFLKIQVMSLLKWIRHLSFTFLNSHLPSGAAIHLTGFSNNILQLEKQINVEKFGKL